MSSTTPTATSGEHPTGAYALPHGVPMEVIEVLDAQMPIPQRVRTPEDLVIDPVEQRFVTEQVIGGSKGKRSLRGTLAHTLENAKNPRMEKQVRRCHVSHLALAHCGAQEHVLPLALSEAYEVSPTMSTHWSAPSDVHHHTGQLHEATNTSTLAAALCRRPWPSKSDQIVDG